MEFRDHRPDYLKIRAAHGAPAHRCGVRQLRAIGNRIVTNADPTGVFNLQSFCTIGSDRCGLPAIGFSGISDERSPLNWDCRLGDQMLDPLDRRL